MGLGARWDEDQMTHTLRINSALQLYRALEFNVLHYAGVVASKGAAMEAVDPPSVMSLKS